MEIAQQTISYNSSPNIPSDISASALQTAIRLHPAFSKFRVERKDDPKYGATWYIHYDEFYIDLPEPSFGVGNLRGGKPGTSPGINATILKPFTNNIIHKFVDHDMLFQPVDKPNVLVTIDDNIMSVCTG